MSEDNKKPENNQEKKEKLVHPIDPNKRVNTTVKEPLKNINRQLAVVRNVQKGEEITGNSLKEAGYGDQYGNKVGSITKRKTFQELLDEKLPDDKVLERHNDLFQSRRLDHMTFPVKIEDEDIEEMLLSVNCIMRKIVHGEQAKHAYFWSQDNRALKDALDMVYKLKGSYAPEKIKDVSEYQQLTNEELMRRKQAAISFYKKKPADNAN